MVDGGGRIGRAFRDTVRSLVAQMAVAIGLMVLPTACGGGGTGGARTDAGDLEVRGGDDSGALSGGAGRDGAVGSSDGSGGDGVAADGTAGGGTPGPTAAQLLALTKTCGMVVSIHPYATDEGAAKNIDICALDGAVFWTADLDIDCDGKNVGDDKCPGSDCCYQPETAFTTKTGTYLAASVTPYVVIPTDFRPPGLAGGAVVAVIYRGKVQYAVFGDTGPDDIIGEASYACAADLGIDPDPATGGTDGPVTYITFLGGGAIVPDIEDQAATKTLGESLAAQLLRDN